MELNTRNNSICMNGDDYIRLKNAQEENDAMINEMVMLKAKVNRLERENGQYVHDNNQLLHENEALRLQSDTYFEQWQGLTELQLTKDSSIQGVPLTNEAYEKAIKEGE